MIKSLLLVIIQEQQIILKLNVKDMGMNGKQRRIHCYLGERVQNVEQ